MLNPAVYTREVKKFSTSQYLYTGVRITIGVMLPTLVLAYHGWLQTGISFVWGALFVSLTDQPGPIHHRRNGLLASTVLNAVTLLITGLCRQYEFLLWIEIGVLSFFFSFFSIYGNRAGSVGLLALVVMVLNVTPSSHTGNYLFETGLMGAGGLWYTLLSLAAYRLRPYRIVQQAMGEYLITLGSYVRAKAAFYDVRGKDEEHYNRLMTEQVKVHQFQDQVRTLLFRTREFIADSAPKGRSLMMMFLDSVDLFESVMSSYQDYKLLHRELDDSGIMENVRKAIIRLAEQLENIGLSVQAGTHAPDESGMEEKIRMLQLLHEKLMLEELPAAKHQSLLALGNIIDNIRSIATRIHRLSIYSHLEADKPLPGSREASLSKFVSRQPIDWVTLKENFSFQSNAFRHATRLTITMLAGYAVALTLPVSNSYWVMLTIVTILRPAYSLTRQRNKDRVVGTLLGAIAAFIILYLFHQDVVLLFVMIICMVMSYSLMRLHYMGFVFFLTIYIVIIFHFLNPVDFSTVIFARLLDTLIGSILAAIGARFILPVWEHEQLDEYILAMIKALREYFDAASRPLRGQPIQWEEYRLARKSSIVALANLSDTFQRMLSEPEQAGRAQLLHQFVVASHTITGNIAAISSIKEDAQHLTWTEQTCDSISQEFILSAEISENSDIAKEGHQDPKPPEQSTVLSNQLLYIYSTAKDIKGILNRMKQARVVKL